MNSLFWPWKPEVFWCFASNYSIRFVFVQHQLYVRALVVWVPEAFRPGLWEFTGKLGGKTLTLNNPEIVITVWYQHITQWLQSSKWETWTSSISFPGESARNAICMLTRPAHWSSRNSLSREHQGKLAAWGPRGLGWGGGFTENRGAWKEVRTWVMGTSMSYFVF